MPNVQHPVSAKEALSRLRSGNARFAANVRSVDAMTSTSRRAELVAGQSPFAIILSCSDSRVPSELVFDCGLGDLFVIRIAGNVVAPSIIGSIEFAAATFGTELVVVMGHSRCGAVSATLDALENRSNVPTENIHDIVARITPAVTELAAQEGTRDERLSAAVRANVRSSVDRIVRGSRLIEDRVLARTLTVVGAEYSLETGEVTFLDETGTVSASQSEPRGHHRGLSGGDSSTLLA